MWVAVDGIDVAASALARVEVTRAVAVACPAGEGRRRAETLLRSCLVMPITDDILRVAARIASPTLRSLDAIHLATAMHVQPDALLTYDQRLASAAEARAWRCSRRGRRRPVTRSAPRTGRRPRRLHGYHRARTLLLNSPIEDTHHPWHTTSPSFPGTAPAPSSPRPRAACSRPPASSSTWDEQPAGVDVYEAEGSPFPDHTLDSIRRTKVGIKGPTTTPVGSGFRSVNVAPAQGARPLRLHPAVQGLRGRAHPLPRDRHRDRPREHRGPVRRHRVRARVRGQREAARRSSPGWARRSREDSGISIKPISVFGSERIVESAFATPRRTARRR